MQRFKFEPNDHDMSWTRKLISSLNEGGIWAVPYNGQVYQIYHSKKELHLIKGDDMNLFNKNKKIFFRLGYKVIDKRS